MSKKIETPLELGAIQIKPAKFKEETTGESVRTGPHVLSVKLSHSGRADVLATYLGSVGSELVAVKIQPAAGGIEPWSGFARIGGRSIKPAGEEGGLDVSFLLSLEGEDPAVDFLPLIELRLAMAAEGIDAATVHFAPTQEDLPFSE